MSLGLLGLFLYARAASQAGVSSVQATSLGTGELNSLRTRPYNTLVGYLTTPLPPYNVTNQGTVYQIQLRVSRLGSTPTVPDYNLLDLQLKMSWLQKQEFSQEAGAGQATRSLLMHTTVAPTVNY